MTEKEEGRLLEALLALREVEMDAQRQGNESTLAYLDVAQCAIERLVDPTGQAWRKFEAVGGVRRLD